MASRSPVPIAAAWVPSRRTGGADARIAPAAAPVGRKTAGLREGRRHGFLAAREVRRRSPGSSLGPADAPPGAAPPDRPAGGAASRGGGREAPALAIDPGAPCEMVGCVVPAFPRQRADRGHGPGGRPVLVGTSR